MKKLIDILILVTIGISIFACNNKSIQNLQNITLDAGPFEVTTPSGFKLIKEKGIDSYVGKITNGKIEFRFDYGWYSSRVPLTYYDYADKYLFKLHKEEIVSTCRLMDSTYQKIKANSTILDAKRNPKFPSESDKEITITIGTRTGTCTIFINNMVYDDISQNYKSYMITESINFDERRKLYYPITGKNKNAGVYIENLEEKRDDKYGHNKLSFSSNDFDEKSSKLIMEILKSVKLDKANND